MQHKKVWLSVYEDDGDKWPPELSTLNWKVSISHSDTLHGCGLDIPYRASPLFPASEHTAIPDIASGQYKIYFLCFESAFPILARLVERLPKSLLEGLYFSLGIASVICICNEASAMEQIVKCCGCEPFAAEIWNIVDSKIESITPIPAKLAQATESLPEVKKYDQLPLTQKMVLDEFISTISLVAPKFFNHIPDELQTLIATINHVNVLIEEMNFVTSPENNRADTLAEYSAEDLKKQKHIKDNVLHQNCSRIIQINIALSYLSTQALSGAIPILERRSLIRRYSLLGVGTAVKAITRMARTIEEAFSKGAIDNVLEQFASRFPSPLPGLDSLPHYDPSLWKDFAFSEIGKDVPPEEIHPKIPYFSGALGFRETEYSISAALQSLSAGGSPEWSLLTLTHEMTHSHVRSILSIILQGDANGNPSEKWTDFYRKFSDLALGRSVVQHKLIDSLRNIILFYCCMAQRHGSLTRSKATERTLDTKKVRLDFYIPKNPEVLKSYLDMEYRNINEIIVHTLDLHYFYYSSLSTYIPLIWRSWSLMPQVSADIRQYILRSLLAAASKTTGTPNSRFIQARSRVSELLSTLAHIDLPGSETINRAVAFLTHKDLAETLYYPFSASLVLVDMAYQILHSSIIRGHLNGGDPFLTFEERDSSFENGFAYSLPEGFVDEIIHSPTLYIADRLAKKINKDYIPHAEYETAILFLACCSRKRPGGPNE